jgi:serine/threonine protein phosphatase 1
MGIRTWLQNRSVSQGDGAVTHVIGDIHGCLEPLQRLLEKVRPRREDPVIFVGDYIDRGPQSRQVVEYLLTLPFQCTFLLGNHEQMLLNFLAGRDEELFLANGGEATLASYGGDPEDIPAPHLHFFRNLKRMHEAPEFLVVHAGIRPMVPLEAQDPHDLVWIRHEFFRFVGTYPKPVVFGHTPLRHVMMAEDRIGIDTGCVYGNKLTCLKLPAREVIQVPGWRD